MVKLIYTRDGVTVESTPRLKYDKVARFSRSLLLAMGYKVRIVRY